MYMLQQLNHGLAAIDGELIALQSVTVEVVFTTSSAQPA